LLSVAGWLPLSVLSSLPSLSLVSSVFCGAVVSSILAVHNAWLRFISSTQNFVVGISSATPSKSGRAKNVMKPVWLFPRLTISVAGAAKRVEGRLIWFSMPAWRWNSSVRV
jgi:hypothetical protein